MTPKEYNEQNTQIFWFKSEKLFVWDWQPWSRKRRFQKGYLRIRFLGFGPNIYYGQQKFFQLPDEP